MLNDGADFGLAYQAKLMDEFPATPSQSVFSMGRFIILNIVSLHEFSMCLLWRSL